MKKLLYSFIIIVVLFSLFFASEKENYLKDQRLLLDSLKSFVEGDPAASDEMEYVIQRKEEAARKKMEQMLEKMATTTTVDDKEDLSAGQIDYVTRKLNLALVYFYEFKYWLTIQECNNVIKVDPKNSLAWIRRGSAYYMLSDFSKSKKDWNIALKLNPNKRHVKDINKFLAMIDAMIKADF